MHRAACLLLLVLAACPSKRTHDPMPPATSDAGCPAASDVYVASYVQPPPGDPGHTGWVLPLHDVKVDSVEGKPGYAPLAGADATAAGVPAAPRAIWLAIPGAPICRATIGTHYVAAIEGASPNLAYGVELTGCPAPRDPSDAVAIALVSDKPPTSCKISSPTPVAARLGDVDKQGRWSPPTKETPIPAAFARVVPDKPCAKPGCEQLWSIASVESGGRPVAWAGAVNWLTVPADAASAPVEAQCKWPVETFSGFFIAGTDGAPVRLTEGQDHPLVLTAVLSDLGGPRLLLAEGTGEYTVYALGNGSATVGRHLVWLLAAPEAYAEGIDRLGPECPGT